MNRVNLSLQYFNYKQLKYHLKDFDTLEYKFWLQFCESWLKYTN